MKNVLVAVDIGSANFHAVISKEVPPKEPLEILGSLVYPSRGLRKGLINDEEEFKPSFLELKNRLDKILGYKRYPIVFGINGIYFESKRSKGIVAISGDEVSTDDIERVITQAETFALPQNKIILHTIPIEYAVDNEKGIKNPLGLKGIRLEVETLVIGAFKPYLNSITNLVESLSPNTLNIVYSPIAAAIGALTKQQKELGSILLDLGATTTSLTVFEENSIIYSNTIPFGSSHITNDLAIGLKIPIEIAEEVKIKWGKVGKLKKDEKVDLSKFDASLKEKIERSKICEIISSRAKEIAEKVNDELKKIHRLMLLPGGAVLIGGGSKIQGLKDFVKEILNLPTQVGIPLEIKGLVEEVSSPIFASAVGLIKYHLNPPDKLEQKNIFIQSALDKIKKFIKNLIP